jgi:hypothetical protein
MSQGGAPAPEAPTMCPICQEDLWDAEQHGVARGIFLPCRHPYHATCLYTLASEFLRIGAATRCPLCRAQMEGIHFEDAEGTDITFRRPQDCVIS